MLLEILIRGALQQLLRAGLNKHCITLSLISPSRQWYETSVVLNTAGILPEALRQLV